jgi:hypothetical protein
MSEPTSGFQRWAQLMDRAARDEALTPEEVAFCERFARDNAACQHEIHAYTELADLDNNQADGDTRALVDSVLARLEAEDAERAVAEVRSLRATRIPGWLLASAVGAVLLGLVFLSRSQLGLSRDARPQATAQDIEVIAPRALTRAELVYASGVVKVEGRQATVGRVLLAEGTHISTGEGVACVLVDSDINLCLAPHSDMRLAALHVPHRVVELGSGVLATRLSTQPDGYQLTIKAGDVASTAVGTAFSVERRAGAPILTTVLNGKVRVAHGGSQRVVNAHERARSSSNEVQVSSLSRTEEASSWALLGPTMLWNDPISARLELSGEPTGVEALFDGQLVGRAPLSSLVPVGTHRVVVRRGDTVMLDQDVYFNAGESHTLSFAEPPPAPKAAPERRRKHSRKSFERESLAAKVAPDADLAPVVLEPPVNAGPSPADLLRSARRLVRDGQLRAAVDTYHSLRRVYPDSQEAHTVLVSLGQLQLSALHDPAEALRLLDLYLQRGGTLSEEARLTRIHALRALRRTKDEAKAIAEFLVRHPRSFEDSTLRARLADLRGTD